MDRQALSLGEWNCLVQQFVQLLLCFPPRQQGAIAPKSALLWPFVVCVGLEQGPIIQVPNFAESDVLVHSGP
jgi:hypothetical protein